MKNAIDLIEEGLQEVRWVSYGANCPIERKKVSDLFEEARKLESQKNEVPKTDNLAVEWFMIEVMKLKIPVNKATNILIQDIFDKAKLMEIEKKTEPISNAIKQFEELKEKAESLKDMIYLDGVLAVLDTYKNHSNEKI